MLFEPRSRVRHVESASADEGFKAFLIRRGQERCREKWSEVLTLQEPAAPESAPSVTRAIMRARGRPRRVLVVDDLVPDRAMGSGFGRMCDALAEFARHGFAPVLYPMHGVALPGDQLVSNGVSILSGDLDAHLSRPDVFYDIVLVSRPPNFAVVAPLVRRHQPWASLIYDFEALFWRRLERQARLPESAASAAYLLSEAAAFRRLEEHIVVEADLAVTVSRDEAEILSAVEGHCPIETVMPLESDVSVTPAPFSARRDIGFVAGWLAGPTSPNADGMRWLVSKVMPLVRSALPWVRLRVTGSHPPDDVLALGDPNVQFEGHVEDLRTFYDAIRVVVSPARYGAGVKLKTVQALQCGVPIVSTTIGAEGIDTRGHGAIDVTDEPEQFAERLITLLTDESEWTLRRRTIARLLEDWKLRKLEGSWSTVITVALAGRPRGRHPILAPDHARHAEHVA